MGRGRLAMKLIEKEKARNVTFQKRKNGIIKKAQELSTLCGVDALLIIYNPNSDNNDQPETWPRDPTQVNRIIKKYKAKIVERKPKNYNVTEFFKDRKNKVEADTSKLHNDRLRMMYPTWHNSFNSLGEDQLRMFATMLDTNIEKCRERISMLNKNRYLKEKAAETEVACNRSHLCFSQNNSQNQDLSTNNSNNNSEMMMTDYSSPLCYYNNGGVQFVEPYNHYSLQKFASSQNIMDEANLQTLPPLMNMQGFQANYGYHDLLQPHQVFNYMNMK